MHVNVPVSWNTILKVDVQIIKLREVLQITFDISMSNY